MGKASKVKKMLKRRVEGRKKGKSEAQPVAEDEIDPDIRKYFEMNHSLSPPYNVILDTNFVNMCLRRKIDIEREMVNCLCSRSNLFVTDCIISEMEKLGKVHRLALQVIKGEKYRRLTCDHRGDYADNCLIDRVRKHPCYLIATCDTELKQRIRKVPGVPILTVHGKRFSVEALPTTGLFKVV